MERPSTLSNAGHVAGFVAGGALAYNGMAPLFTSAREGDEGYERSAGVARRMGMATEEGEGRGARRRRRRRRRREEKIALIDREAGKKVVVGVGAASSVLALESVFVALRRALEDGNV
jgi:hypothetical protein|eukprot:31482-Pelagococcus_subviridis.AAC.3